MPNINRKKEEVKANMGGTDEMAGLLALMIFKIDTTIELLIQKGIMDKDEFKKEIFEKIEQGQDEELKIRMKENIEKLLNK